MMTRKIHKASISTITATIERKIINKTIHLLPKWIKTYHLTMMTVLWSVGVILFGYLSSINIHYLWFFSFMIFLQWFTDSYDGAIGRLRNTGLVKWGFYMDHLLDYVFVMSVIIGYSFLLDKTHKFLVPIAMLIFGTFIISVFLKFCATNQLEISYFNIGMTELRLLLILSNTITILLGQQWLEYSILMVLAVSTIILLAGIFQTHRTLWRIDMQNKKHR